MTRKILTACLYVLIAIGLFACGSNDNDPIANAGTDQNVVTGTVVTLDGSSSDGDGELLVYTWSFVSIPPGSNAKISDATVVRPTFTADVDGVYVVQLVANGSDADTVSVTAATANSAPIANAGSNQSVNTGTLVTLDGGTSSDANSDLLSYNWSFVSRPTLSSATLSSTTVVGPTFTSDVDGDYVIQLVVNDGAIDSVADTVTVTAATVNSAPVANAGPDQSIATGNVVTLDGSASSDANSDLLSYNWSFVSRPALSNATLSEATVVGPTFTADIDGDYVLQLIVSDGAFDSVADTVTVTAATANSTPVANAGADQSIATGSLVTLDGSASSDANNDPLIYSWSFVSVAGGSALTQLTDNSTASPSFTPDVSGDYVAQLIVYDGTVDSTTDTMTVTAVALPLILNGTWTTQVQLQADVSYDNSRARAAVNSSGNGVISWSQGNPYFENATVASIYDSVSGSWDVSATDLSYGAADPTGASESAPGIDAAGHVMVAREVVPAVGTNNVTVFHFDPAGSNWDSGTVLETAAEMSVGCTSLVGGPSLFASYPQLAMNGAGTGIVAWDNYCVSSYGRYTNVYASFYNPATEQWTSGSRLDNYYSEAHNPVVAIGSSGHAAVAWTHDLSRWSGGAVEGLYTSVYNVSSGLWTTALLSPGSVSGSNLCVDASGNVAAIWRQIGGIFWARYDAVLQTWSTPDRIDSASGTVDSPVIACDGLGNVTVTWRELNGTFSLMSRRYIQSTSSWEPPTVVDSGLSNLSSGHLGVDENGNAITVYLSSLHLYASRLNAQTGDWSTPERLDIYDSNIDATHLALDVNASGETLVTWVQSPDNVGVLRPLVFASRLE